MGSMRYQQDAVEFNPVTRLGLFALLYFVGLGIALVIFLNSKLLTTIKEEE